MFPMEIEEIENCKTRLAELRVEHRDLDDVIDKLAKDPHVDEFRLKRLKKRKLLLKDEIIKLEDSLLPDIIA